MAFAPNPCQLVLVMNAYQCGEMPAVYSTLITPHFHQKTCIHYRMMFCNRQARLGEYIVYIDYVVNVYIILLII